MVQIKVNTGLTGNSLEGNVSSNSKKKRKTKATFEGEVQSIVDTKPLHDLAEGNVTMENPEVQDEAQSMKHAIMETGLTENSAEGNVTRKWKKKRKIKANTKGEVPSIVDTRPTDNLDEGSEIMENPQIQDEAQSMKQTPIEMGLIENFAEENVTQKRKKKWKSKVNTKGEAQSIVDTRPTDNFAEGKVMENPEFRGEAQSMKQIKMVTWLTENSDEENTNRKRKKKRKTKANIKYEVNIPTENLAEGNVTIENPESQGEAHSTNQTRMETVLTENSVEGNLTHSRKSKRKGEANIRDEIQNVLDIRLEENVAEGNDTIENPDLPYEAQSMDQDKIVTGLTVNIAEGNVSRKRKKKQLSKANIKDGVLSIADTRPTENLVEGNMAIKNQKFQDDVHCRDQTEMDTGRADCYTDAKSVVDNRPTENHAEGIGTIKNTDILDEAQHMGLAQMETGPTENSSKEIVTRGSKRKRMGKERFKVEVQIIVDTGRTENLAEGNVNIENAETQDVAQCMGLTETERGLTENSAERFVTRKRKKKRKGRENIKGEAQSIFYMRPTENLAEGNVTIKNPEIRDESQVMGQSKLETGPTENLSKENLTLNSDGRIHDKVQMVLDTRRTENPAEGNATIKNAEIQDEAQGMGLTEMEAGLEESSAEGNVTRKSKKRRKRKVNIKDEIQSISDNRLAEHISEGNLSIENSEMQEVKIMDQTEMNLGLTENSAEGNVTRKRKKKRKYNANIKDEDVFCTRTTENLAEGNTTIENPNIQEAHSRDQIKMDTWRTEYSAKVNVTGKIERKHKRTNKAKTDEALSKMDTKSAENLADENGFVNSPMDNYNVQSMDKTTMDMRHAGDSAEGNATGKRKRKKKRKKKAKVDSEIKSTSQDNTTSTLNCEWNSDTKLRGCGANTVPMDLEKKLCTCECHLLVGNNEKSESGLKLLSEVCNQIILAEGKGNAEATSAISASTLQMGMNGSSFNVKDANESCPAPITSIRKKLLVLDVNGLLADIVCSAASRCQGDIRIYGRAVFKRPFCDDFLKFCFQNFDVGIWSSRSKKIIDPVVSYLLGDQKDKLRFCWDMDYATKTGFNTLENRHKPLVCKELRKIWGDGNMPWKKGDYNESNTLLLDDSPYKALLNPLHTAIFPNPYEYSNKTDDSLGPGGDLRVYLEGLVTCENMQKYVEQHPFGQRPITEKHSSWGFYRKVIHRVSNPAEDETPISNQVSG